MLVIIANNEIVAFRLFVKHQCTVEHSSANCPLSLRSLRPLRWKKRILNAENAKDAENLKENAHPLKQVVLTDRCPTCSTCSKCSKCSKRSKCSSVFLPKAKLSNIPI